jgi:hypothetical protein
MPAVPKMDPARRNARVGPLKLPPEGYQGERPRWPLHGPLSQAEQLTWREMWTTPQAAAWATMGPGCVRVVARYVRVLLRAEHPHAVLPTDMAEARQLEDKLGLTPKAMRMLLWEIAPNEVEEQRAASSGARGRIKAV